MSKTERGLLEDFYVAYDKEGHYAPLEQDECAICLSPVLKASFGDSACWSCGSLFIMDPGHWAPGRGVIQGRLFAEPIEWVR